MAGGDEVGGGPGRRAFAAVGAIVVGVGGVAWAARRPHYDHAGTVAIAIALGLVAIPIAAPYVMRRKASSMSLLAVLGAGFGYAWTAIASKLLTDELAAGTLLVAVVWLATAAVSEALALLSEMSALQRRPATHVAPVMFVIEVLVPVIPERLDVGPRARRRVPLEPRVIAEVVVADADLVRAGLDPDVGAAVARRLTTSIERGVGTWAISTRAPVTSASSATRCTAATSANHERASFQAAEPSAPSSRRRVGLGVDELRVLAMEDDRERRAAALRSASSMSAPSEPGYMPSGATRPVKILRATTPASTSASTSSGRLAQISADDRVVDVVVAAHRRLLGRRWRLALSESGVSSGISSTVVTPPRTAARVLTCATRTRSPTRSGSADRSTLAGPSSRTRRSCSVAGIGRSVMVAIRPSTTPTLAETRSSPTRTSPPVIARSWTSPVSPFCPIVGPD